MCVCMCVCVGGGGILTIVTYSWQRHNAALPTRFPIDVRLK